MTPHNRARCLMLLSALPSSTHWNDGASALYSMTIEHWDDQLGLDTVDLACVKCTWRPAPAELIEIAVQIAFPAPSKTDTREAMRLAVIYHGRKAAKASTPFLSSVAETLGGWPAVCAMSSEEIAQRFDVAYKTAVANRSEESLPYLRLPAAERNVPQLPSAYTIERLARLSPPITVRQIAAAPGVGERGPQSQKELLAAKLLGVRVAHQSNEP
jgi:hypothetical protein